MYEPMPEEFFEIYDRYKDRYTIIVDDKADTFYSYIIRKVIEIPRESFECPDRWDAFALLHEVGHLKTNTVHMKRCTQEYLATQWALAEAEKIGLEVPDEFIEVYQNYIWKWRETSIKHRGKDVPSREELTLTDGGSQEAEFEQTDLPAAVNWIDWDKIDEELPFD